MSDNSAKAKSKLRDTKYEQATNFWQGTIEVGKEAAASQPQQQAVGDGQAKKPRQPKQ